MNRLFTIYGLGLFFIAAIISLLYVRSLQKRIELQLNDLERHVTKLKITSLAIVSSTGLISAVLAFVLPDGIAIVFVFLY